MEGQEGLGGACRSHAGARQHQHQGAGSGEAERLGPRRREGQQQQQQEGWWWGCRGAGVAGAGIEEAPAGGMLAVERQQVVGEHHPCPRVGAEEQQQKGGRWQEVLQVL